MNQYLRECGLVVSDGGDAIDLSGMHIKFEVKQEDKESPNNARIIVYNLSETTKKQILQASKVNLKAGYKDSSGVIFSGDIKQFKLGKDNATDTYIEILAAEGDIVYNYSYVNTSIPREQTGTENVVSALSNSMGLKPSVVGDYLGGTLPRGKVLYGMTKTHARALAQNMGHSWSITGGELRFINREGYLPDEAVVLNANTGLVGIPEQTEEGIKIKCLLNPKIITGGLVKLDNVTINQLVQQRNFILSTGQQPYDKRTGFQLLADVSSDGLYRAYVVEHSGDTRGTEWYTEITALAVNQSTGKVEAK